jgi:hypothetical protein
MQETTYKVLMYNGGYVDFEKISSGIYTKQTPSLYDAETTIENLIVRIKDIQISDDWTANIVENLRQCELVEVKLTFVK